MHSLDSSAARWQNPEISYDLDIYNILYPSQISVYCKSQEYIF